jgi:hypothetical protein
MFKIKLVLTIVLALAVLSISAIGPLDLRKYHGASTSEDTKPVLSEKTPALLNSTEDHRPEGFIAVPMSTPFTNTLTASNSNIPKQHTYTVGTPDVNEFVLNWTDKRDYSNMESNLIDTGDPAAQGTRYSIRMVNETGQNVTLVFDIDWHPRLNRPPSANLEGYPTNMNQDSLMSRSDIMIQGKSGQLFTFKETKTYEGSSSQPFVTPPHRYARYFLDAYTEVGINGNVVDWSSQDFNAMLSTLKITPPVGYY